MLLLEKEKKEEEGGKLPCVDHDPLNEGAVGKRKKERKKERKKRETSWG